jgi:crotonobetainyl-CoA:carnitine CoA-transferase CaiB-like acyl-CoA transferase
MPEAHWWPRFCTTVAHPEWIDDPRFATVKLRFDNMPEIIDLIDEVFATKTLAEWGEIFDRDGLIWGPASTLVELAQDPQAEAVGLFPEIEVSGYRFRTVGIPFRLRDAEVGPRGPAPHVGEHSAEILVNAGLTDDEVEALAAAGVIGIGAAASI